MKAFSDEELGKLLQDALQTYDNLPAEQRALSDLARTVSWVCGEIRMRGRTAALSKATHQRTRITVIRHHVETKIHPLHRHALETLLIIDAGSGKYAARNTQNYDIRSNQHPLRAMGLVYPLQPDAEVYGPYVPTWLGKLYLNWLTAEQDWGRTESLIPANLSWRTVEAP